MDHTNKGLADTGEGEFILNESGSSVSSDQVETFAPMQLSVVFPVSAQRLYEAWTDPEQVKLWWRPMDQSLSDVRTRFEPGGELYYAFDQQSFEVKGIYKEVIPGKKLVFTWEWNFTDENVPDEAFVLDLSFTDQEHGCLLTIIQEGFTDHPGFTAHQNGWEIGLKQLREYLEANP